VGGYVPRAPENSMRPRRSSGGSGRPLNFTVRAHVGAMNAKRVVQRYLLLWLSIALFALCLANDGYYIEGPDPRAWAPAWGLLLFGWIGLFSGTIAWLANPALLTAWVMFYFGRYRRSAAFALIAAALMVSFLFAKTVVSSEAPTYSKVTGYGLGYWLWVASAFVLLIGAIRTSLSSPNAEAGHRAP